ncbi:COG4315 family predicted lipoprotein [Micromonospora chokoriensis]
MLVHSRVALSAIALASLAALGACGDEVTGPAAPATASAPTTAPTAAQPTPSSTAEVGTPPEVIEAPATPLAAPTVAKTQGRVRIYSGPSDVALSPAPDTGRGSTVIQLNGTASAEIGTYVADGQGRTLYRFDKDRAKPSTSNCNGECATVWPPLLVRSPGQIYPSGINPKLVGYVERADGTCQVTIGGWPVYLFAKDAAPGDVKGQGVGDTWFAISPTGERTSPLPGTPTTAAS